LPTNRQNRRALMGGKNPSAIADCCSGPTISPHLQRTSRSTFLETSFTYVDWTNSTASYPRCRRSWDAARATLEPSAGCCDGGHILRIYGVSRGRRTVQEYRRFPEMVGHSGCCLGFCALGNGFCGDGGGSRQNKQTS